MFQTFETRTDPAESAERVAALRARLSADGLDGFLIPRADEHQGEYVPAGAERLAWLTGFTGSAGMAIVLKQRAAIFVDGRYTLQVRDQVNLGIIETESLIENPPAMWLGANLPTGSRLGYDPWLHTIAEAKALTRAVETRGSALVAVAANPLDAIWPGRPAPPLAAVRIQPLELAGELARDKLARLAKAIADAGASHAVLTDPSSIAWASNIRGGDVPHTPLPLGFAILGAHSRHDLFLDERKLSIEVKAYLTQLADLKPPAAFEPEIARIAAAGGAVGLDPALAADRLRILVETNGGKVVEMADPARLPRAAKNAAELVGTRAAHRRDGAALAAFLAWFDGQPPGAVDEIAAVTRLEEFRRATGESLQMPLRDISFDTISGAGPNGAVIHYRVSRASNRRLAEGELFLLDSGAQYQDGTTDVTRTLPVGQPTDEMRERYTLVLKGLIAISSLRFPPGTRGVDIDAAARVALWKAGLDYAHGTGHGVGSFLSVHEGPQRIAKTGTEKLLPGMILSNEPGYYKAGQYGIRLENLIVVEPAAPIPGGDIDMHGWETLTLVPFDRRLIRVDLLGPDERAWLDDYHRRVLAEVGPLAPPDVLEWLRRATAPLADQPSR